MTPLWQGTDISIPKYGQNLFIQINLGEQLIPETFEWTLNEVINNEMDLSAFDARYKNDREGRAAVNLRSLLKVVLYGYSRGILSSRKLENLAQNNIIAKACQREGKNAPAYQWESLALYTQRFN